MGSAVCEYERPENQPGEYDRANKDITIRDLLTHRAGLTYSGVQKGNLKLITTLVLGADMDNELTIDQGLRIGKPAPGKPARGNLNYGKSLTLWGLLLPKIEGKPLGTVMDRKHMQS